MIYVLGWLILLVGVAVSIALHEVGHLLPAKAFGVKVTQYMVGFGPTVWSRRRGETEYGIKAIPLGGYVRMIGMLPPRAGDAPGRLRSVSTGRFSQMMDQARADSLEEVGPGDEERVFYKRGPGRKMIVMLGGPMVNLLIAAALSTAVITLGGLPEVAPKVGALAQCLPTAAPTVSEPQPQCVPTDPTAPAAASGLHTKDVITSINGRPITTWDEVTTAIRANAGKPMTVVVRRGDSTQTLTLTPQPLSRAVLDAQGKPVTRDGKIVTQTVGFAGITPQQVLVRQPITAAPGFIWDQLSATAGVVLKIPQKMVGVAQAAFGSAERDPNGPISIVGLGRIAGEIAAMEVPADEGGNWAKLSTFVMLIAGLNLALFVFNLIPLLPLDGGHVAGAIWEAAKKGWARLRHRPDPGYVDVAKALPVAYGVSLVLITMSVLLIYADIVRPVRLFG